MLYQLSKDKKTEFINRLADNLPVFRAKLNITQTELADRIGVTKNTLTQIENKKREMTWVTFVALLMLFIKNSETSALVDAFGLNSPELEKYLMFNDN